jgi:hypothetical protein
MINGNVFTDGHKIMKCGYEWSDNSAMNFTAWETGQPGQYEDENCLILYKTKWHDLKCDGTDKADYICEGNITTTTICPDICLTANCNKDVSVIINSCNTYFLIQFFYKLVIRKTKYYF